MRKIMSIMLAVALVFTTLALPMSAFAAKVVPDDATVQLVYALDSINGVTPGADKTVYPGDIIVVSANINPSVAMSLYAVDFRTTVPVALGTTAIVPEDGYVNGSAETSDAGVYRFAQADIADGTKVLTASTNNAVYKMSITVPEDATAGTYTIKNTDNYAEVIPWSGNYTVDFSNDPAINNLTVKALDIAVGTYSATVSINGTNLVAGASSVKILAEKATVALTTVGSKVTATLISAPEGVGTGETVADGAEYTVAGDYVISVTWPGKANPDVYNFTLDTTEIAAKISTDITGVASDADYVTYTKGTQFEVPVVISGIGSVEVGMVQFDVTYDPAYLTIDKTNLTVENNIEYSEKDVDSKKVATIIYGDNTTTDDTLLTDSDPVTTLKFTVNSNAAYDSTELTFAGTTATVEGIVDGANKALAVSRSATGIIVVPSDDYATVSDTPTTWQNTKIDVTVTTDVDTKVYIVPEGVTIPDEPTQVEMAKYYEAATIEITAENAAFEVDTEQDYVVVSAIGTTPYIVYQADVLKNGEELLIDKTGPAVTVTKSEMDGWVSTRVSGGATFTIADYAAAVDDDMSDIDTAKVDYVISYAEGTETVTGTSTDGTINIAENTSPLTIALTFYDKAGNAAKDGAATIDLNYDGDLPTIDEYAVNTTVDAEGYQKATFKASDATSEVKAVYYYESDTEDFTSASSVEMQVAEGVYTYATKADKYVKFVVVDSANNKSEEKIQPFTFAEATQRDIKAIVVKNGTPEMLGDFLDTVAMEKKDIWGRGAEAAYDTNGTFTYVKIEYTTPNGFVDEVEIKKTVAGEITTLDAVQLEFDQDDIGAYEFKITTTSMADESDTEEITYKFEIVEPANMKTANGDSRYNMSDYSRVKTLVGESTTPVEPTKANMFYGGYFSADLNGDLATTSADFANLLSVIMSGKQLPTDTNVNFAILNK